MTTSLRLKTQDPASIIVIRSARGAFCGKTFEAADCPEGFAERRPEPGLLWHPRVTSASDPEQLLARLQAIASLGDAAVIRGQLARELTEEEERAGVYRRMVDGGFANGVWKPCPRTWVALDLDGAEFDEGDDPWANLSAALPEPFASVSFVWNRTASHLLKPGFRGRLFFLLDRPVEDGSLRTWAKKQAPAWMHLDPSLFTANHIHYVASPRFEVLPDPCPSGRWGLHRTAITKVPAEGLAACAPADGDYRSIGVILEGLPEPNLEEIETRLARIRTSVTKGARHAHANGVACELIGLGMAPELVEVEVEDLIRRQGRDPQPGEGWGCVRHAVGKLRAGRLSMSQRPAAVVLNEADAQEAAQESQEPLVPKVDGEAIMNEGPGALYGSNDMINAGLYAREIYPEGGFIRWAEQDWEWVGTHWRRLENDEVLLQRIQRHTGLKANRASATVRSFRSLMGRERLSPPCMVTGEPLRRVLVFQNGVLDIDQWLLDPGAALLPHDPQRFVTNALPYDYKPGASCPRLRRFLESIWPEQLDQRREYQKMLGYLLLQENPLHKMFIILGAPRSGKGTTLRLIKQLVGADNCCSPNLSSLENDFGLDPLIGRSVALIGEMNQQTKLPDAAIDRIKSISGGDDVPVNRKNKGELHLTLPVRFIIACNRLPGFLDPSGAFAARLVIFTMWESYLGKEDRDLGRDLEAELPGIAQFALEGLRMLLIEDGEFTPPQSAKRVAASYRASQAPALAFLEEAVQPGGAEDWLSLRDLYGAYCAWARERGHTPLSQSKLAIELEMRWPALADISDRKRVGTGTQRERLRNFFRLTEVGRELVAANALPNE